MWRQQITMQTENLALKYVTRTFKGFAQVFALIILRRTIDAHIHLCILLKLYQNNAFCFVLKCTSAFDNLKIKMLQKLITLQKLICKH